MKKFTSKLNAVVGKASVKTSGKVSEKMGGKPSNKRGSGC